MKNVSTRMLVVLMIVMSTCVGVVQSSPAPFDLEGWTDLNPHQVLREDIIFASNRNGNFDLWIMNADGSDQRQLLGDDEWDEIEGEVNEEGTHLAYLRCDPTRKKSCEFHVTTYPDLTPLSYHNNAHPGGGIEWTSDAVYSIQTAGNLISRTFVDSNNFEGLIDWPQGIHPVVDGPLLIAYQANEGTVIDETTVISHMASPTLGAADSDVLGECWHGDQRYLCSYHTIMGNLDDPAEFEGSAFEMAFGPKPDQLTGLVFVRQGRIYWAKYDLSVVECLTCE